MAGSTPGLSGKIVMKIIFFSDAHLDEKDKKRADLLVRFINDVCPDADMVFILGDLFEFYHGHDGFIYPWYEDVIESLKGLTNKGKGVYFVEGNHEFQMGSFFQSHTGIKCADYFAVDIDGRKTFIAHGHEIKKNYLTTVLKTRFIYRVMDTLGPNLTWKIASLARIFLSKKEKPYSDKAINDFRRFARKKFDEGYGAVIMAHSHIPDEMEHVVGNIKKDYLNTGDIIKFSSYVEYNTDTGFEIKKYNRNN